MFKWFRIGGALVKRLCEHDWQLDTPDGMFVTCTKCGEEGIYTPQDRYWGQG